MEQLQEHIKTFQSSSKIKSYTDGSNKDNNAFEGLVAAVGILSQLEMSKEEYKEYSTGLTSDGGCDFIIGLENGAESVLHILQAKNHQNVGHIDVNDFKNIFVEMADQNEAYFNEKNGGTTVSNSTKLDKAFRRNIDRVQKDDSWKVSLHLFCSCEPPSPNKIAQINEALSGESKLNNGRIIENKIYWAKDINRLVNNIDPEVTYVDKYELKVFRTPSEDIRQVLYHPSNDGVIVSLNSTDLNNLHRMHEDKGLYEQNFRYHVDTGKSNKKIDSNIKQTIQEDPQDFWFMNNGLVIGCRNFEFINSNEKIKLNDFSIINGCQTVSNISKSDNVPEFPVVAKIVKPHGDDELSDDEFKDFLKKIAESSNSQKAIDKRDLKSNDLRQAKMKKEFSKLKLDLLIKRGQSTPVGFKKINNKHVAQLIMACLLSKPGTARSDAASLFDDNYESIFTKDRYQDAKLIMDLNYLYDRFREFKEEDNGPYDKFEDIQQSLGANGNLFFTAFLFWTYRLYKIQKNEGNITEQQLKDFMKKDDMRKPVLLDVKTIDNTKVRDLFLTLFPHAKRAYENFKTIDKKHSVSGLLKGNDVLNNTLWALYTEKYLNPTEFKSFKNLYLKHIFKDIEE